MFGARENVLPIFGDVGIALAKATFIVTRLVAGNLEWDFTCVSCGFHGWVWKENLSIQIHSSLSLSFVQIYARHATLLEE
jgi:hypothetical protein